jgi:hypothetical protein
MGNGSGRNPVLCGCLERSFFSPPGLPHWAGSLRVGLSLPKKKTPSGTPLGVGALVEAAGQLFHLFRDGLDYAFILLPRR